MADRSLFSASWGRWWFPLPEEGRGRARGLRLAWTAMQLRWVQEADERPVTQITPPEQVLSFLEEMPGLVETCEDYPRYLAMYVPQLTIPGMSGRFEAVFEDLANDRGHEEMVFRRHLRPEGESTTALNPEYVMGLASHYVSSGTVFGPPTRTFAPFDYTVWLHTAASSWLPPGFQFVLRDGFRLLWGWHTELLREPGEEKMLLGLPNRQKSGALARKAHEQLTSLVANSLARMKVQGHATEVATVLAAEGFLEARWRERRRPRT